MGEHDEKYLDNLWNRWLSMPLGDPGAPELIREIRSLEQLNRE